MVEISDHHISDQSVTEIVIVIPVELKLIQLSLNPLGRLNTMPDQIDLAKQQLVALLKEKRAVLLVGAGSSKFVGFPLWSQLVQEMQQELTPQLVRLDNESTLVFAQKLKDELEKQGRLDEYYNFLTRKFEPKSPVRVHDDFHLALVQLGWSGLITTNYDEVLESAVREAFNNEFGPFQCDELDLCHERPYLIFEFLRSLSTQTSPRWILHLHGYWKYPQNIILTAGDYLKSYGVEQVIEAGRAIGARTLDSLHRKVIWSILVMHSVVFVGFSMEDEYFMKLLDIVQIDFTLGRDRVHFALMPYSSEDEKPHITETLYRRGVQPVFYHVPSGQNPGELPDYTGLKAIIFELAESVGTPSLQNNLAAITRRMLSR